MLAARPGEPVPAPGRDAGDQDRLVRVFAEGPCGTARSLRVCLGDTVLATKALLCKETAGSPESFRLSYRGAVLEDAGTLARHGVAPGAVLGVSLRLLGGGSGASSQSSKKYERSGSKERQRFAEEAGRVVEKKSKSDRDSKAIGGDSLDPEHSRLRKKLRLKEKDFLAWMSTLSTAFPKRCSIDRPEDRGINLVQLELLGDFVKQNSKPWIDTETLDKVTEPNFFDVKDWVILPATMDHDCSFVELVATREQTPKWFCSHWFGEAYEDFVRCVRGHRELRALPSSVSYWVWAFAERLNEEYPALIETSFQRALPTTEGVLLILDLEATAFNRAWCGYELYVALCGDPALNPNGTARALDIAASIESDEADDKHMCSLLIEGFTKLESSCRLDLATALRGARQSSFPLQELRKGIELEVHTAGASDAPALTRILNRILGEPLDNVPPKAHERYDEVAGKLRARIAMAGWLQARAAGGLDDWGFPEILAAGRAEKQVWDVSHWQGVRAADMRSICVGVGEHAARFELRCHGLPCVDDFVFQVLGRELPKQLRQLQLDFSGCENIGDRGVAAFAAGLPPSLEQLRLEWSGCTSLGDGGLAALGKGLPDGLRDIGVNVAGCVNVSNRGLASLAAGLPRQLELLALCVASCPKVGDSGLAALAAHMPQGLRRIQFEFKRCESIGDHGLAALAVAIPPRLEKLLLDFGFCWRITEQGLAALMAKIPKELPHLKLSFAQALIGECAEIGDMAMAAVGAGLPPKLRHLDLSFEGCRLIGDAGLAALGSMIPRELEHFKLNFSYCTLITNGTLWRRPVQANLWQWAQARQKAMPTDTFVLELLQEDEDEEEGEKPGIPPAQPAGFAAPAVPMDGEHSDASNEDDMSLEDVSKSLTLHLETFEEFRAVTLALGACQHLQRLSLTFDGQVGLDDGRLAAMALKLPPPLQQLTLNFKDNRLINNGGLAALAAGMPKELKDLCLKFEGLAVLGDSGVAALASGLPESLDTLELEFVLCSEIGDQGLGAVGHWFPHDLLELRLNFSGDPQVGNDGLAALAVDLPKKLQLLHLDFTDCTGLHDAGLLALSTGMPKHIKNLFLKLNSCPVTDHGIAALSLTLPRNAHTFRLDLGPSARIGDGALSALAVGMPHLLRELQINMRACTGVKSGGLSALGAGLLKLERLERLRLDFSRCTDMINGGLAGLAAGLPPTLCELHMDLSECGKLGDGGFSALGGHFPRNLDKLHLNLAHCALISDNGVSGLVASMPWQLQEFDLNLDFCVKLTDGGLAAIALSVPTSLHKVGLVLSPWCNSISDEGLWRRGDTEELTNWANSRMLANGIPALIPDAAKPEKPALLTRPCRPTKTAATPALFAQPAKPSKPDALMTNDAMADDEDAAAGGDTADVAQHGVLHEVLNTPARAAARRSSLTGPVVL